VCDQHIPASPAHGLPACLLWAFSVLSTTRASVYSTAVARQEEGRDVLLPSPSLQRGHETVLLRASKKAVRHDSTCPAVLCSIGRGKKRPSRNCHVSLAPGTWPYLGGLMQPRPLARRACVEKQNGPTAHCLRQKRLPRTCIRARLAAAGTECTIYTSSPASRVLVLRRACNHIPRNCNFACTTTLLALLSSGRAPAARFTGLRHVLPSISPDSKFCCAFHYVPPLAVNCASLWLLPTPSGVGRIARGNIYNCSNRTRSRTLSDSREAMRAPLHPRLTSDPPPVIEILTGDFMIRDHESHATSSAFIRDPSHELQPHAVWSRQAWASKCQPG